MVAGARCLPTGGRIASRSRPLPSPHTGSVSARPPGRHYGLCQPRIPTGREPKMSASAPAVNFVTLVGNLTADPVLKQLDDERKVCNLRLAVNDQKTSRRCSSTSPPSTPKPTPARNINQGTRRRGHRPPRLPRVGRQRHPPQPPPHHRPRPIRRPSARAPTLGRPSPARRPRLLAIPAPAAPAAGAALRLPSRSIPQRPAMTTRPRRKPRNAGPL